MEGQGRRSSDALCAGSEVSDCRAERRETHHIVESSNENPATKDTPSPSCEYVLPDSEHTEHAIRVSWYGCYLWLRESW